MRQETRQNLVLRLSLSAEKQNGDKGRHYRALLTYWINTFFENQCCRPERFRRYSDGPNIYGGSNVVGYASPNVDVLGTGAFSAMTRWVSSLQISTDGTNASSIQFNAGNSNSLYGLSGTVQPAGIYGLLLLKAY